MEAEGREGDAGEEGEVEVGRFVYKAKVLYVQSWWRAASFAVAVQDGSSAWRGDVSASLLASALVPASLPAATYLRLVRDVFAAQENPTGRLLVSKGVRDPQAARLTWHIRLPHMQAALKGEVELQRVRGRSAAALARRTLDALLGQRDAATACAATQRQVAERLEAQNEDVVQQLAKVVKDKQGLEADMYAMFAAVLNEKKQTIARLQDQVALFERSSRAGAGDAGQESTESTGREESSDSEAATQEMEEEELQEVREAEEEDAGRERMRRLASPTEQLLGAFDAYTGTAGGGRKRRRALRTPLRTASRRMADALRSQAASPKAKRRRMREEQEADEEEGGEEPQRQAAVTECDASQLFAEASF